MARSALTLDEAIGHHGKIIKYYRHFVINPPHGWTQEQLAEALDVSVRWVQEMERMPFIQSVARRKALTTIFGIPRSLLDLEEHEKLSHHETAHLQLWVIDSLEVAIRTRWQLYYTSSNSVTEEGLLNQIDILEQLADNGGVDERRLYRILSQSYQLAGSLARDNFHYSRAKKYLREAQRLAQEAQLPDLETTAIARQAVVLLRQERFEEALTIYQRAASLTTRTQYYVGAYVYSGLAEAWARNKHQTNYKTESYRALDHAQNLLAHGPSILAEENFTYVRLTAHSLEDTRGECYMLLGEPKKGLEYLQKASQKLDLTMNRRQCRLLMQQAEAYLAAGQPDDCVHHTLKGLQLAQALESPGNINWAREIHTKLLDSKWKSEPVVGKLGAAVIDPPQRKQ